MTVEVFWVKDCGPIQSALWVHEPEWQEMEETDRERHRAWLRQLGVDPARCRGYELWIELATGLEHVTVELICWKGDTPHLHRTCPGHTQEEHDSDCEVDLHDLCIEWKVMQLLPTRALIP